MCIGTSYKIACTTALALFILVSTGGCRSDQSSSSSDPNQTNGAEISSGSSIRKIHSIEDFDFGEDWMTVSQHEEPVIPRALEGAPSGTAWSVNLKTFATGDHRTAAKRMLGQLPSIDPELARARIHTTPTRTMVVFGSYESAEDPSAQAGLKRIKSITMQGRPVFSRAMLVPINLDAATGNFKNFELLGVRLRLPEVDPLYTLDIAVWGTNFESGDLAMSQIQEQAESYARQLRARGVEAYFHHTPQRGLSTVTVGLFNHRAIDAQSGILSTEVRRLIEEYSPRLVNGKPQENFIDPQQPNLGTRAEQPRLVLVPKL